MHPNYWQITIICEYFVKIFSDSLAFVKIKHTKIVCTINDNVVQGPFIQELLSEKLLHEILCPRNIRNPWYDYVCTYFASCTVHM